MHQREFALVKPEYRYLCGCAHVLAGFGLTLCTGDSRSSTIASSGAVDVRVSATLLDGHLIADAVSSAQNHLSGV